MLRVTLRSLWEHKRRLVSTVVAIVLGVAFMSGTFIFADTINRVFDDLFSDGFDDVDTRVQGVELFDSFGGGAREKLDESLLATVAGVDGVRAAEPFVQSFSDGATNRVLGRDGDPLGARQGPPTLIESWMSDDAIRPYVLTEGSGPSAPDEIALNVAAADEGDLAVGDPVTVITQFGEQTYTLVGTFRFGTADSAAGAVSASFVLPEAQRLAGMDGKLQAILVDAVDGVDEQTMTDRVAAVLPPTAKALTGTEAAEETASAVQEGFSFFRRLLTIFGGIALLVGTFIIANTFSILIAQRTRELALLRAIGASRRQVLGSVLLEAVVIGLVAAVSGLLAGVALATGVSALLDAAGAEMPNSGLVVSSTTVAISFVIGLVVTVGASILPAIGATRVPPLAALRDVAVERTRPSRLRIAGGALVMVAAAFNLSKALGSGDADTLPSVGIGSVLLIVGAIVLGPALAEPTVRVLGGGLPRLRGITGTLATENAARSPKRTAATASALLITVALIGFLTIFGASAQASVSAEVERGFTGDLMVQAGGSNFGPPGSFPATVADDIAASPLVDRVARVSFLQAQLTFPGDRQQVRFVGAIEAGPAVDVFNARMAVGALDDLTPGGIILDEAIAEDVGVGLGDPVTVTTTDGTSTDLVIQALSDDFTLLGPATIHLDDYRAVVAEPNLIQVVIGLVDGTDIDEAKADIEARIAAVPTLEVLDADDFAGTLADQITGFLTLVNGLLLLSVVIAMIGIANTLSLSIHERTRELGLLRAVGMTRAQLRSAVRWEAVIIALLGTLVGIGVGLVVSWSIIQSLSNLGLSVFVVPPVSLLFVIAVTGALGVLASIRPARRAARMDVLAAIATE